ncbi:MAG: ATP-binding protein [Chitinophagales bacterium]|nr:ATP-binding protein [Chitinophagales bacterium]
MTNTEKQQITEQLRQYLNRYDGSIERAANSLKGISKSYVRLIVDGNYEGISDEKLRTVAVQVGYRSQEWNLVSTRDYKRISLLLADAQMNAGVFAMTGNAGSGKTVAINQYASENAQVYVLQCNEYWNRKYFLKELLQAMGRDHAGLSVSEMMLKIVEELKRLSNPLIIMDEADKLTDKVLYFFITLYNQLEDHCGIVMAATDHLDKRLKSGLNYNKKGYQEIYSRIGRRCIELKGVGETDIMQVCMANGVDSKSLIKEIIKDSQGDLRRVKRKIHAIRAMERQQAMDIEEQEADIAIKQLVNHD